MKKTGKQKEWNEEPSLSRQVEQIRRETSGIQPPEELQPSRMMERLQETRRSGKSWVWAAALVCAGILIVVGARQIMIDRPKENEKTAEAPVNSLEMAKNYQDIYQVLKSNEQYYEPGYGEILESTEMAKSREADSPELAAEGSSSSNSLGLEDYSDTNVMEAGIDEGDVIKTDGVYFYILQSETQNLRIVRADDLKQVGLLELKNQLGEGNSLRTMYVSGDHLVLIASMEQTTSILTYDITDRSQPKLAGFLEQQGFYTDSRLRDGHLYVVSVCGDWSYTLEDCVPKVNGKNLEASRIFLPEGVKGNQYTVVTAMNLQQPKDYEDQVAVVCGYPSIYVSSGNVYLYYEEYKETENVGFYATQIVRIAYDQGALVCKALGSVQGSVDDSFSLNEYNGYLRILTIDSGTMSIMAKDEVMETSEINMDMVRPETSQMANNLYILDESLDITGQINGIAKGEMIRSARFMGDTGYFVTFAQTDPLFTVDLSDPKKPQIVGELKVSGFSQYLHFWGKDRILGIGQEAEEDTGIVEGLKLSMFDIQNPLQVTEENRLLEEKDSSSNAEYDYKSILVDPEKNLLGFQIGFSGKDRYISQYKVYSYDKEQGFKCQLTVEDFQDDEVPFYVDHGEVRGIYIGQMLYVIYENQGIKSYSLTDYSEKGTIQWKTE